MTRSRIFFLFACGVIAGGGIVVIVMNYYFSKEAGPKKNEVVKNDVPGETREIKKTPLDSTNLYIDKKLPIKIIGDTVRDYYPHIDENSKTYDSLKNVRDNEPVKINRDVQVGTKKIKATKLKPVTDSTGMEISMEYSGEALIEVEFWQSPIKYKGYKLGKLSLEIFGIHPEAEIMLFELNDYVILQDGSNYYKLIRTKDFKPLKRFNDEKMILALKYEN